MSILKKESKKNALGVFLIGGNFKKDAGQGIEKYCTYLSEFLQKKYVDIDCIELGSQKNSLKILFNGLFIIFLKTFFKKSHIYHFTTPEAVWPCILKRPSIVTIYDLIPYILKKERKNAYNFYFKVMMNFAKRADHIIVISESTKKDVIKLLKVHPNKISRIYLGVDHNQFYPVKNKKRNKTFVAGFLGGLAKRKNAKILLEVAEILKNEKIKFKIGGKGSGFKELEEIRNRKGLSNVEFLGFIPDNQLNKFYNSLDLFIAPTTYDGFCMPGLEAMASGCPIIVSHRGALPEVSGNAGILINPHNAMEIAKNILKIKKNRKLQIEMSKKGVQHAKKFTWDKCANETIKVYKKVMGNLITHKLKKGKSN